MRLSFKLLILFLIGSTAVFAGCTSENVPVIEDDMEDVEESHEIGDDIIEDTIDEEDDVELGELI